MKVFYVYQLRLATSELPFYIGKGKKKRHTLHLMPYSLKEKSHKNRTILKAMRDGVEILSEILFQNLSESDAHAKEIELIALYGRRVNGGCLTNATDGGEGLTGWSPSNETRKKMSESHKGRKCSPETCKKISDIQRGKTHPQARVENNKFSQWNRSPGYAIADEIFKIWCDAGKPSGYKMRNMDVGQTINMINKFVAGWNPSDDPTWMKYKSRVNHVGETAEPVHVLESHLGTNEIFHAIPVVGNDKNVQVL